MIPICVFASGRGSNFVAIQEAIKNGILSARILAVISDRPDAAVLGHAWRFGIPARVVPVPSSAEVQDPHKRRRVHESRLLEELSPFRPEFLVLAGYMRIFTPDFIARFRCDRGYSRMVNIHPSLLPAFSGIGGYSQAFRYGVKLAGATVHLVDSEVDQGAICDQQVFDIHDCQSESEVEEKGLQVEHSLYPKTLQWVLPEKFSYEQSLGGRFCVRQS